MATQIFTLKLESFPKVPEWELLGEFEAGQYSVTVESSFSWVDPLGDSKRQAIGLALDLDSFSNDGKLTTIESHPILRIDEMYSTETMKAQARIANKGSLITLPEKCILQIMRYDQSGQKDPVDFLPIVLTVTIEGPL